MTNRIAMVVSPHADDAAVFIGATISKFSSDGWKIILVRVTDDSSDSVDFSREETIIRNASELQKAASIMGISEIVDLGYETDTLAEVSELELREKFVFLIRKHQPYALFSFDPMGLYENNQDHIKVSQAVDEALWVSAFDKHYPQHYKEGYPPFSVCERWFFGRKLPTPNHVEDVSQFMAKKIQAVYQHQTMMKHTLKQYQMQLNTWGKRVKWIDESYENDHYELLATFLQEQANTVAKKYDLGEGKMGEEFRLERFGDFEELFQAMAEPIQGEEPISREGLDLTTPNPVWTEAQFRNMLPENLNQRINIMGHHHLCAGAFDCLLTSIPFQLSYPKLVEKLRPSPNLEVQTIYGYDLFCYQCSYWSEEDGRCSTGWKNKISKDSAVLDYLGIPTGTTQRLEDLQRLLAEKITPEKLEYFCGSGEWKCESFLLGICQKGYESLRKKYSNSAKSNVSEG
jgi:LmbE family N-acetylglucosaminyl deacetylase